MCTTLQTHGDQISTLNTSLSDNLNHISGDLTSIYGTLEDHYQWIIDRYTRVATQVQSNVLTETRNPGTYLYNTDKVDKPNDERGAIISFGYEPSMTARIAITESGLVYTSMYTFGQSYGTWKRLS